MAALNIPAVTEDLTRVQGVIAGCGQAALLAILHAKNGLSTSPQELQALIVQGINSHQAGTGGVSSPANLQWLAAQYGTNLQSIATDTSTLSGYAGNQPIILGVSNASAFGGSDVGVHGHYVTIIGQEGNNFLVDDPNTIASQSGQYVTYTKDQVMAAQPFWAAVTPVANVQDVNMTSAVASAGTASTANLAMVPAVQGVGGLTVNIPGVSGFFNQLGGLMQWLGNPVRIIKLIAGAGMISVALWISFIKSPVGKGLLEGLGLPLEGEQLGRRIGRAAGVTMSQSPRPRTPKMTEAAQNIEPENVVEGSLA